MYEKDISCRVSKLTLKFHNKYLTWTLKDKISYKAKSLWAHRLRISLLFFLTHWGRDEINAVFQMAYSNVFSWMKMYCFRLKFHWSLFSRAQLTRSQHWFKYWLEADQATSHYLKQWWIFYWHIYASLGLNELNSPQTLVHFRDNFVYAPSQWEMTFQCNIVSHGCNVVSHWLGTCREWSLHFNSWKQFTTTWTDPMNSRRQ